MAPRSHQLPRPGPRGGASWTPQSLAHPTHTHPLKTRTTPTRAYTGTSTLGTPTSTRRRAKRSSGSSLCPAAVVLRKVLFRARGHSGSRYPRSISFRSHCATAGCLRPALKSREGEVIEQVRGRTHGHVGYGEREGG